MNRFPLVVVCALLAPTLACEPSEPAEAPDDQADPGVRWVDRFEAPEDEGSLTAADRQAADDLAAELTEFHGERPRRYNGLVNGNVEAETCFVDLVSDVTAYVNERLAARGHSSRLDEYEVAMNFISEGGYFALDGDRTTGLDGFADLGVDTLVNNYAALRPYIHPSVQSIVDDGTQTFTTTNEKSETVSTLSGLTLEDGLYANAGMFAYERGNLEADLANPDVLRRRCAQKGKTVHPELTATELDTLPQWQQYFWTTVYFNCGTGCGRAFLCERWLPWASEPYRGSQNNRSAKFNASWRTSSYRFMAGTAGPSLSAYCEARRGSPCTCDRCNLEPSCDSCTADGECSWCGVESRCRQTGGSCGGTPITDAAECPADASPGGPELPCGDATTCNNCFGQGPHCGWCESEGACMDGEEDGADMASCADWEYLLCDDATDPLVGDGGVPPSDTGVPPTCGGEGAPCFEDTECCDEGGMTGACVALSCALCTASEATLGSTCDPTSTTACCGVARCGKVSGPDDDRCCLTDGFECVFDTDCCGGMRCNETVCACQGSGEPCIEAIECCGGLVCTDGVCGT